MQQPLYAHVNAISALEQLDASTKLSLDLLLENPNDELQSLITSLARPSLGVLGQTAQSLETKSRLARTRKTRQVGWAAEDFGRVNDRIDVLDEVVFLAEGLRADGAGPALRVFVVADGVGGGTVEG